MLSLLNLRIRKITLSLQLMKLNGNCYMYIYKIQQKCLAFLRWRQHWGRDVNILVYTRFTLDTYIQIKITRETHSTTAKYI